MITLCQLESFVSVAKEGNFSRGAEKIFLSQPTVSTHINSLEEELGTKLIFRTSRSVSLTEDGKKFFYYACEILSQLSDAVGELQKKDGFLTGNLQIAASSSLANYLLPKILNGFKMEYPDVLLTVKNYSSEEAAESVSLMESDLGLVNAQYYNNGCEFIPFGSEKLVMIVPNNSTFESLLLQSNPETFESIPFIARNEGSGTRKAYEKYLSEISVNQRKMNIACELSSTESVIEAVSCGMGYSFVLPLALREEHKDFYVKKIESNALECQFYLVWKRSTTISPLSEAFINYVVLLNSKKKTDKKKKNNE